MIRLALAALLVAGAAQAEMTTSPRPMPRPAGLVAAAPVAGGGVAAVKRPVPRPALALPTAEPVAALAAVPASLQAGPRRPMPRPAALALPKIAPAPQLAAVPAALVAPKVRPLPRPASLEAPVPAVLMVRVSAATDGTLRPKPRPDLLLASAPAAPVEAAPQEPSGGLSRLFGGGKKPKKAVPTDGYVCGDPDIRGDELAPITSKVKGCGVEEPVRITSIEGVRLRGGATVTCETATALKTWMDRGMRPSFSKEVVELQIAGSYVCRPRNNIRGNKISEHGRGKAVDISAFVFSDGSSWTVKDDYNRQIRKAHKAACGIFGTTLGPGSDGYHEDHLHFDTAGYRNGPYCR